MPSRLKLSINDFEIRPSLPTGLVRFNNFKMPRNESRLESNDLRSKGRHRPLGQVPMPTQIYKISISEVSLQAGTKPYLLP